MCHFSFPRVLSAAHLLLAAALPLVLMGARAQAAPATEPELLRELADGVIAPELTKAASTSQGLAEAVRDLCERKSEAGLKEAQQAWRQAYLAWRSAQPAMLQGRDYKAELLLEHWPANEAVLKGATADAELLHLLNSPDVRGFSGVEYLLFTPVSVAEATTQGRCAHLQAVVGEIANQAMANQQRWQGDAPAFVAAGDGEPYLLPGDALALVFARMINVTEEMLRDRLNTPSGFFTGESRADLLEAWHSGTSRQSFQASIDGLRRLLTGAGDGGIAALVAVKDGLVSKKNPQLAQDIRSQLERIDGRIAGLPDGDSLHSELQRKGKLLQSLYRDIEQLQKQIIEAALSLEIDVRGPNEDVMP